MVASKRPDSGTEPIVTVVTLVCGPTATGQGKSVVFKSVNSAACPCMAESPRTEGTNQTCAQISGLVLHHDAIQGCIRLVFTASNLLKNVESMRSQWVVGTTVPQDSVSRRLLAGS